MPDQPTDPRWLSPEKRAKMCKALESNLWPLDQGPTAIRVLLLALDLADEQAAKQAEELIDLRRRLEIKEAALQNVGHLCQDTISGTRFGDTQAYSSLLIQQAYTQAPAGQEGTTNSNEDPALLKTQLAQAIRERDEARARSPLCGICSCPLYLHEERTHEVERGEHFCHCCKSIHTFQHQ